MQFTQIPCIIVIAYRIIDVHACLRSFAIVIQQLPRQLRDSVCIFYLVLRALDTVEDDMSIPIEQKVPVLRQFHTHIYERYFHSYSTSTPTLAGDICSSQR